MGQTAGQNLMRPNEAMQKKPPWRLFMALAGLLIFMTRLPYALNAANTISSDSSLIGLMALHISQGQHFPLYYYGQSYMGAAEAYIQALAFLVFEPSPVVMSLVNSVLFTAALLLNALWVRRFAGGGLAAAGLFLAWLCPPFFYEITTHSFAGYTATLLFGAAYLWMWSNLNLPPDQDAGRALKRRAALSALFLALGLWTWSFIWLFALPALLFNLARISQELGLWEPNGASGPRQGFRRVAGWLPWVGGLYTLYALGVVVYGQKLKLYAGGIKLLSTSPVRALSQDLPIGLGLVLAGLAAGSSPV